MIPTYNWYGFTPRTVTLVDTGHSISLEGVGVIPEPSTLFLIGAGSAWLCRWRRKHK